GGGDGYRLCAAPHTNPAGCCPTRASNGRRARHAALPGDPRFRALVRQDAGSNRRAAQHDNRRHGGSALIVLGLTGSIGMGKSTTAKMFSEEGVPVHDADSAVHRLYAGEAAPLVEALFPGTVRRGIVDREKLAEAVVGDPQAIKKLEAVIHPLVRADSERFLDENRKLGTPVVVLDIPLLFEKGGRERVDKVVVVTAPAEIQRERVLARPGMTEKK